MSQKLLIDCIHVFIIFILNKNELTLGKNKIKPNLISSHHMIKIKTMQFYHLIEWKEALCFLIINIFFHVIFIFNKEQLLQH